MLKLLTLSLVILLAATLPAHEFWIEPAAYTAAPGAEVGLQLRVGEYFGGEAYARNPDHVSRFFLQDRKGSLNVEGAPGDDPAGRIVVREQGVLLVGYRSKPSFVELGAEKFENYLREEGLEHVIELRAKRGEHAKPGRESFSRCAKSLLHSAQASGQAVGKGSAGSGGYDRELGLTLEIIPEQDPAALGSGGRLTVRILYGGKPCVGQLVKAWARAEPKHDLSVRSDEHGRVEIPLSHDGAWLVSTVHMEAAPSGLDADWQSIWSSLTFEVPRSD